MTCHYVANNILSCSDRLYVSAVPLPISILLLFSALFVASYLGARYFQKNFW